MQRLGRKKEMMGGGRKQIFLGLGLVMVMGLAVYLRLWTIDYNFSSSETELLRRQIDLASREAMDESAVWRKRYDDEEKISSACQKELIKMPLLTRALLGKRLNCCCSDFIKIQQIKQLLKEDGAAGIKKKLDLLQNVNVRDNLLDENIDLLERLESLKQELESEKLKCSMKQI